MAQIIELTNSSGLDYLRRLVERGQNLRPVLAEIGEDMSDSTKQRFNTATTPDGAAWAPNSAVTLAGYSANFARKKDGSLTKASSAKLAGKKPGTGETRALATTINYQVLDENSVGIGSPMVYAAMFNFGGKKSEFPHLWGDIPARQFLGASEADKTHIGELIRSYMLEGE